MTVTNTTIKKNIVRVFCVLLTAFLGSVISSTAHAENLSSEERESRLSHAHELLGKYYSHSVVLSGEQLDKVNGMIYKWTRQSLPKSYRSQYKAVAQAIIDESLKNDFDPIFVSSVIVNESSFNPSKIGGVGEIGLMQLRPETAKWIAKHEGLKYKGKASLKDPVTNIKLGTAFLSYLREKFDSHARLYIAAYNMGQGNVKEALERKVWPKDYALRVMKYYISYYRQIRDVVSTEVAEAD